MFELPNLPFEFDALEPHIDAKTMEIHHDKHHAAYVNNLNTAVEGTEFAELTIDEVLTSPDALEEPAIRNNAGGHFNHSFFWEIISSNGGGKPSGELMDAIENMFESFEIFQELFTKEAIGRFGSGWAWLIVQADGNLALTSTPNQDNPLMLLPEVSAQGTPILGLDVWEHAYYLKYQNKRTDYVKAFWEIVDWKEVERRFTEAIA